MPNGLGEHPPLSTKNLLLTRGLIDEAIGGASPAFPAVSVTGDCPNFIGESNNAGSDQVCLTQSNHVYLSNECLSWTAIYRHGSA